MLCIIGTFFLLFMMLAAGITPDKYDIAVGTPASVTIYASKDIEDTVTTQLLRNQAADAIEPSYKSPDTSVLPRVMRNMQDEFSAISEEVKKLSEQDDVVISDELVKAVNMALPISVDAAQLSRLLDAEADSLTAMFNRTVALTKDILNATLPEGKENSAILSISKSLLSDGHNSTLVSVCTAVVRNCLVANMLIDEEITEANREKARNAIEPERVVKGEVIVRQGEIVTKSQYTMIGSLGLLADDSFDVPLFIGVALLILTLLIALSMYLFHYDKKLWAHNPKMVILLCVIFLLTVGLCLLVRVVNVYLMPAALGLLLIALLVNPREALYANLVLSMLISLLAYASAGRFTMAMFSIFSINVIAGPAVVMILQRRVQRTTTFLAGLAIACANFVMTFTIGLMNSDNIVSILSSAAWAAGGGLLSSVLCIGLQPLLEWVFNIASSAKLLELSNPNHPLLRRMLLEAPGTYHHSIIVANLAEAAANAIGANGLLARVGSYYHDVGKLKRPIYFKENQMGDNPHNRTDPRVSTAILTAHTRDGVQFAQKARIPEPILDIIREHHGDTPVIYFYDSAVKQFGEDVDIAAFRYEGPRPQTKESAIVMLADTVEAATRAMPDKTPESVNQLIRKLVRSKMTDGQLDQSDLTFRDLEHICFAFFTVLSGVFHERIEYPEVNIPPRNPPVQTEPETAKSEEDTHAD